MPCKVIETLSSPPQELMDLDFRLLKEMSAASLPILHLYEWDRPCGTYGHFVQPFEYLSKVGVGNRGLSLAKRPTGGGIVLHTADYAFSCLIPAHHPRFSLNTLENYALINEIVIQTVERMLGQQGSCSLLTLDPAPLTPDCRFFCMAKATQYDVIVKGQKIGGAAQRRTKEGFLHQGTISLATMPDDYLKEILLPGTGVFEAMKAQTFTFLGSSWRQEQLEELRKKAKKGLTEAFQEAFN